MTDGLMETFLDDDGQSWMIDMEKITPLGDKGIGSRFNGGIRKMC